MLKREINIALSLLCLTFFISTLPLNAQPVDTLRPGLDSLFAWCYSIMDTTICLAFYRYLLREKSRETHGLP